MADPLDPATMDALNALGDEIEAENGKPSNAPQDGAGAETGGEAEHDTPEGEEAAHEAQDGQETTSENEGDPEGDGTGDEQPSEKPKPVKAVGADKRIKELTREKYEARNRAEQEKARREAVEHELAELKAAQQRQPAADPQANGQPAPAQPVTQRPNESGADFNARVQAEARRLTDAAAFNEACNRVAMKGAESHKDFADAQGALMGAFGRQVNARPEFLKAIIKLDNGHDVFHYLGTNLEAAEKLFANADPVDLIVDIKELSGKLKAPKAQKISNAPAPVTPIRGGGNNRGGVRLDDDKADMGDWSKQFLKDMAS